MGFRQNISADCSVLMAHSEDSSTGEEHPCRHLAYHPRAAYPTGAKLKLNAETIEQLPTTYAYYSIAGHCLHPGQALSCINEYGLAICGNTIYTKEQTLGEGRIAAEENFQLVMERWRAAKEGVGHIAQIQDTYGSTFGYPYWPGVACFIADLNEVWLVECAPRHGAAKRCPDEGAFFSTPTKCCWRVITIWRVLI